MNTSNFHTLTVRIHDDNPFYASLLQTQIRQHVDNYFGYLGALIHVHSFTDHDQFVASFEASRSIAFVDYYLSSTLSGTDLIQPIRAYDQACNIIILTDSENLHIVRDCMDKGAGGLIFKSNEAVYLCASAIQNALNNCTFQ